ncbi:alpha/beta hydrolase fold domain-containing protein [Longispora urticae]
MQQLEAPSDLATPRLTHGGRAVVVLSVLLTLLLLAAVVALWAPLPPADWAWKTYLVTSEYALFVTLLGLLTLGLTLALRAWQRYRLAWVVTLVAVLAVLAGLLPTVNLWLTARSTGTHLSLGQYFTGGINLGKPDPARTVTYATVEGRALPLDVWLPPASAARPAPVVVTVHGGAFVAGQQGQYPKWNAWLNERGYAVFDIQYRLAPPPRWNQAAGDVKCAVGWVREHAERYGVDPTRIVLMGESAGGTLALLAAYSQGDAALPPSCPAPDTSVTAVVGLYPATDLVAGWHDDTLGGYTREAVEKYTGGTPATAADAYRIASPLSYVRGKLPPTLLVHGEHDALVDPETQSVPLSIKLDESNVPHELVTLPMTDHGYDFQWGGWGTQITRHALGRFLDTYVTPPR